MFKKSLALLLTAMMILSCFTTVPVLAKDASTPEYVTLTPATVAQEDFSDYLVKYDADGDGTAETSTGDKNIVYAYPSSAVTGYGWAANWSTSATEYVAPVYSETTDEAGKTTKTDDKIWAYHRDFKETSASASSVKQGILKLNAGKAAYRQLATPLTIGETDGVYTFSVDVMHVNSSASYRTPFRFDVGGLFSFGFEHELTAADATGAVPSYAVPVIGVGETDTPAETKLLVGGGSSGNPEYVTYTVTLNIDADGADTITLTAQDRQTYQFNWTNVSADISTVTVENADIKGTINYIGLGGKAGSASAVEIQNIKITKSEAMPVEYKEYALRPVASDALGTDAGYTAWTDNAAVNTLFPATGLAGSGFANNWSGSADGTTALSNTVQAYLRFTGYPELKITSKDDGAYRKLSIPIATEDVDGKYTFSFFTREAQGAYGNRSNITYHIGNGVKVGYTWTENLDSGAASGPYRGSLTPFIQIGDSLPVSGDSLVTYGGYNYAEIVKFDISVDLNADGEDLIILKAQDVKGPAGYFDTTASVEIAAAAELTESIDYIGVSTAPVEAGEAIIAGVGGFEINGVSAFEAKTQNVVKELIAEETFTTDAGYTAWSGKLAEVIPENTTEFGWVNNWSADVAGNKLTGNTTIETYNKFGVKSVRFTAKTDEIYRKLAKPIVTDGKNAAYTFAFSATDEMSGFDSRSGLAYHLGDGLEIGYNWTELVEDLASGSDIGLITPYIKIGNEKITNGTLTTYGNSSSGEWIDFTLDLELFEEGSDYLTLTVQDKNTAANVNKNTTEKIVIRVKENITENIDYVGFTNNLDGSGVKVAFGGISISGGEPAKVVDDAYPYLNIAEEYLGTAKEDITSYGFEGDWTAKSDGTGELDTSKLYYKGKNAYIDGAESKTAISDLRLAGENKITSAYRQLADTIYTNGKAGSYTFTFDVADGMSEFTTRANLAYKLGAGIEVGYTLGSKVADNTYPMGDEGLITPYIKVGGETYTNGTLTQFGNDASGEFTTFTVKINLNADGADLITLTAQDNTNAVVNEATTNTTESVTVTANANITENIDYIGFANTGKVDIRNVTIKGYGVPVSQQLIYPVVNIAKDVFDTYEGYTSWDGALSGHFPATGATGYGFANNWSNDPEGTDAVIDTVKANSHKVKTIRLESEDAVAYRKLAAPIMPKAKDGEYTFTFSAAEGTGSHSARASLAYMLGDSLEVGYKWTTLVVDAGSSVAGAITPYIKVNGIEVMSEDSLTTYGGYATGEFVTFTLNIKLDADGADLITLTAKDKTTDTYGTPDAEEAVVAVSAQLAETIEYIGFKPYKSDYNEGKTNGAMINICDIVITGVETPVIEEVNTPATTDVKEIFGTDGGYATWVNDTAISGQYDGNKVTGTGFANNWSQDAEGTETTADGVMTATGHKINSLRLNGAVSAYRQLETPIAPAGKSGTYIFKFSAADAISAYTNRKGISYYIGKNIEVGYDWTEDITEEPVSGADAGYITPYIKINGTEIKDENKKLATSGNNTYGEWVDFELKVELGENGNDLLMLTVKDNADNVISTTDTTASVTLAASANLGESIEYIGFATKGGKTDFANIEIASSKAIENQPRTEKQVTFAEDTLNSAAGYSFETNSKWFNNRVLSTYLPSTVTKSGWGSNWTADTAGTALDDSTANVISYTKNTASGTEINTIRLVKGNSAIYRSLENSINLNNADASYTFTYSTASGMGTSAATRNNTNFHIGNVLTVGHKWDGSLGEEGVSGDPAKLVPYIKLANGSEIVANDYLRTFGGDSTGELVTFDVKLDLFKDGLDTITLEAYDRADNLGTASADDKLTIQLAAELSGSIDYIGFTLDGSTSERKVDFTDFKITTYNEGAVNEIIAENIGKMGLGYESARIIDSVVHPVAKETLMAEFNKYGYAYDGFDAYTDLRGTSNIEVSSLNGGAGWDGAWTGSNIQIRENNDASDKNVMRAESPVLNVSRKLATPIDLSVDGEYFVKVSAYVDCTGETTVPRHNLAVGVGNIVFGSKGYYGTEDLDGNGTIGDAEKARISPTFGTEGTATVIDETVKYSGRNYNDYILRIVSKADEADKAYFYFVTDGAINSDALAAEATITSDEVIDTITLTNGTEVNAIRIAEVAVDCWNDSITAKSLSMYEEDIIDGTKYSYYTDYKAALDAAAGNDLPESTTTDYYTASKQFKGIVIESCELQVGNSTDGYTNVSDISALAANTERNVRIRTKLNNLGVWNEGSETGKFQSINMLIGFYYDGKLLGVKRAGIQSKPGSTTTLDREYDFPTEHKWPATIDYTKVDVKLFIFDWITWAPLEHAVEINNSRTEIDGAEKIYVSPSYEGDASDGTQSAPYKTIEEAQAHIAALNTAGEYPANGISVYIEEGEYTYATESLTFNSNHGGAAGAPVKFIADGEVNIVGGLAVDLDDFKPTVEGDAVYNANVVKYTAPEGTFAVGSDMFPISGHQLAYFEEGTYNATPYFTVALDADYMSLARWPNASEGYAVVDSATSTLSTKMTTTNKDYPLYDFTITDAALANKTITGENIYIHGYWTSDFADFRTTAEYDAATNTFTADYPAYKEVTTTSPLGGLIYDRRYYVSNSPDLLDAPGEWYIEGDTIYLYPTKAEGTVTIGLNTNPVIYGENVDNIVFDGININGSRNRGATFGNCDNIKFKNASITNVNDQAIAFNTCTDVLVDNCTVAYTGTGGIDMGGTAGSFVNQKSENNRITNSVFHDFGLWQKTYAEAISFGGYKNTVSNNTIYNTPGQAVGMSGFDNVFAKNEVYNVVSEASDMGAIYVGKNPSQRGNTIEQNYFHDIKTDSTIGLTQTEKAAGKTSTDIAAIFLDDCSAGYIIRNNVFEDMGGSAIKTNGARANLVTKNVFINNNWNVRFSCNGLGYNETDGYFMWTQDKIDAYTGSDKASIQSSFNKYWGYIQADSAVTSGAIKEAPYTKYSIANGYTEDIATYYSDEPMLAKYNVFKDNWTTGATGGDYGFREGNEEYMTSEASKCEFVASAAYDASDSMTSLIGIELSAIGAPAK